MMSSVSGWKRPFALKTSQLERTRQDSAEDQVTSTRGNLFAKHQNDDDDVFEIVDTRIHRLRHDARHDARYDPRHMTSHDTHFDARRGVETRMLERNHVNNDPYLSTTGTVTVLPFRGSRERRKYSDDDVIDDDEDCCGGRRRKITKDDVIETISEAISRSETAEEKERQIGDMISYLEHLRKDMARKKADHYQVENPAIVNTLLMFVFMIFQRPVRISLSAPLAKIQNYIKNRLQSLQIDKRIGMLVIIVCLLLVCLLCLLKLFNGAFDHSLV